MKERPMLLLAWVCVLGGMAKIVGGWSWFIVVLGLIFSFITVNKVGIN